jgi:lipopolysaccharide export LptBFGC system permease protein LptF
MDINRETLSSPAVIFIGYIATACLFIMGFRLISPGEVTPLPIFAKDWRLIRGLLDIFALFPALAFSGLVVPFGRASGENDLSGFSQHHFQHLMTPLITAICAACAYALVFFLVLPLAQNREENLRYQGDVYRLAKEQAQAHRDAGEWLEVSQFIGICDSVWNNSPEITELRNELEIHMRDLIFENKWHNGESARNLNSASVSAIPGQGEPLDAGEAIALGEAALADERPFDAHWLATLGGRLAKPGSPETTKAAQLASRAWNQIESLQPTSRENRLHSIYLLKSSGYQAMVSGDWIRAYYIFKELLELTPTDPDVENFFKKSEKGTQEYAFFIDEMGISLGRRHTDILFSLPVNQSGERSVLRVDSLSSAPDFAYGTGIEYMVFDSNARPLLNLKAPYAKFLPITLNGQPQVLVMMRVLDRHDRNRRWEPEWSAQNNAVYQPETAQIILHADYETFLMLSEMRQELPSLHIDSLFAAASIAGETGYIPEVFQAEILNRLGSCLFFLPMAVIAIVIGWRLRAKHHPRYLFVLLLPILPLVFSCVTYLYQTVLNLAGISLILHLGFSTALAVLIVILASSFIFSLILLAAQHD